MTRTLELAGGLLIFAVQLLFFGMIVAAPWTGQVVAARLPSWADRMRGWRLVGVLTVRAAIYLSMDAPILVYAHSGRVRNGVRFGAQGRRDEL